MTGITARMVTALCPRRGDRKTVTEVVATRDLADTTLTLRFTDGSCVTLNEADYPCSSDSEDKLYQ